MKEEGTLGGGVEVRGEQAGGTGWARSGICGGRKLRGEIGADEGPCFLVLGGGEGKFVVGERVYGGWGAAQAVGDEAVEGAGVPRGEKLFFA